MVSGKGLVGQKLFLSNKVVVYEAKCQKVLDKRKKKLIEININFSKHSHQLVD